MFNNAQMMFIKIRFAHTAQEMAQQVDHIYENNRKELSTKENLDQLNKVIVDFLVNQFYDVYPEITDVAYKARYEFCQDGDMIHVYPNEVLKKFFLFGNVKPTAYLIKV